MNDNLKLFKWKESKSIMSLLCNKYGKPVKCYTGMDRVFILFKNDVKKYFFFIFSGDEFFSKGYKCEFKDNRILAKTLDFSYIKESQYIILYGKNKMDEKCLIAYDFIQDLILFTIFLPKEKTKKVRNIRGKVDKDHSISHIVVSYEDRVLIYEAPFIDGKINKYKTFNNGPPNTKKFLEFGKINYKKSDKVQDVLFFLTGENTQTEPEINNVLAIKLDKIVELQNCKIKKCFLLGNDTVCINFYAEEKHKVVVFRFDNDQIKPVKKLEILLEKDSNIFGCKHYIFELIKSDKSEIICNIYDHKYVPDNEDEKNNNQTKFKNYVSNFIIQKKFDSYLKLHHISKEFLFLCKNKNYDLVEIYEEEPSFIIDKLVSTNKYFEYAKQQAKLFSMSPAEIADIEWKQANFIFNNSSDEATRPERAMDHFIKTIGFVPSSFVIQLYMDYKEETLIRYLWGDISPPDDEKTSNDEDSSTNDSIIKNLYLENKRSSEHLKLLISICVNLYLENKKKELIKDPSEKCYPKQILTDIFNTFFNKKTCRSNQFDDCSEDLIDAFLAIDDKETAKIVAENTNNKERMLKLYFETIAEDANNNENINENANDKLRKNYENIVNLIFNINENETDELSFKMKEEQMKFLNQYGRELFYLDVEDIDLIIKFIEQIANFAINEKYNNKYIYIQQICLLFVPQRSAVNLDLKRISDSELKYKEFEKIEQKYNSVESQQKIKDLLKLYLKFDQTRMSILFYAFYQKIKEKLEQTKSDDLSKLTIINNVYIQHLIILCRNIYKYVINSKESMKFENKIFFIELKKALRKLEYNINVAFLSIVDLSAEEEFLKFEMLNYICLEHEKYASKLIHLVSVFKSITDDKITSSINTLCKNFGKKNPNLFIEAITELIQNSRCIDMIPSLLEESSKYIPLPDIITSILQLPSKTLESNRKLSIGLIKKFVVNWMKKMKEYEAKLTKELESYEEELKNIPNKEYTLDQMMEIRNNYEKMLNFASNPHKTNINVTCNIPKRPFSTVPISDVQTKIDPDDLTRGTVLPERLLRKIGDGALIHGLDADDPNIKNFFSIDKAKMIDEFDQMYNYLNFLINRF